MRVAGKDGIIWLEVMIASRTKISLSFLGELLRKTGRRSGCEAEDLKVQFSNARNLHVPGPKGPVSYFRYIITGGSDEDETEEFPELPEDLKKLIRD
jgi:hypothetical protein